MHKVNKIKLKSIIVIGFLEYYFIFLLRNRIKEPFLKIYIITHKDFHNFRYNPVYTIVADDKLQLKNKYGLNVIYSNDGKLYKMKRAYSEMSKLYYIYELYKTGKNSSKYIGLNHYRRYFNFTDNIPDLDKIFENYDVILDTPDIMEYNMRDQFCICHNCKKYDEIIDIIKEIKPEYYETALKTSKEKKIYFCNLFIMKKNDFLKYCEFMYDVLFEFDKRNNYTSDEDLLNYSKKLYKKRNIQLYQSRLEAFLSERIGNIFYYHNFKRIKIFNFSNYADSNNTIISPEL